MPKTLAPAVRSTGEAMELFHANRRLAFWTVARFVRRRGGVPPGLTEDDLAAAADEALWRACRVYDPGRGVKFSTFAVTGVEFWLRRAAEHAAPTAVPISALTRGDSRRPFQLADRKAEDPSAGAERAEAAERVAGLLRRALPKERDAIRGLLARRRCRDMGAEEGVTGWVIRQRAASGLRRMGLDPDAVRRALDVLLEGARRKVVGRSGHRSDGPRREATPEAAVAV